MSDLGTFKDSTVIARRYLPDDVGDQYCGNCADSILNHKQTGGKCLFGPTDYRLETDEEWKTRIELWTDAIMRSMFDPNAKQTPLPNGCSVRQVHDAWIISRPSNADAQSKDAGQ